MAVKYMCPKCNRRFTEWGAEKYGFKCPDDQWRPKDHPDDVELVRVGMSEDRPSRRPSLKKGARKLAVALPTGYGDEPGISGVDDLENVVEFPQGENNFEDSDNDEDEVIDEEPGEVPVGEVVVGEEVVPVEEDLGVEIDITDGDAEEGEEVGDEVIEEEWTE